MIWRAEIILLMKLLKQFSEIVSADSPALKRGVNEISFVNTIGSCCRMNGASIADFFINTQLQLGVKFGVELWKPF
jgi:hypothetical protein